MAQIGAVFVFCSSCKILYFASSVHPKNATVIFRGKAVSFWALHTWSNVPRRGTCNLVHCNIVYQTSGWS